MKCFIEIIPYLVIKVKLAFYVDAFQVYKHWIIILVHHFLKTIVPLKCFRSCRSSPQYFQQLNLPKTHVRISLHGWAEENSVKTQQKFIEVLKCSDFSTRKRRKRKERKPTDSVQYILFEPAWFGAQINTVSLRFGERK